jgi:hypothetical protein
MLTIPRQSQPEPSSPANAKLAPNLQTTRVYVQSGDTTMLDTHQWFAHAFFKDAEHANAAVRALLDAHFHSEHIGVLMVRGPEVEELPMRHKTFVPQGAAVGALFGAAAGALTLSGIGVLAVGPLFAALQGAAAGSAMGTLAGTLGGLGFWRDEVDFPSDAFQTGAVLVGVVTNLGRTNDARRVLASVGAERTYLSTKAEAADAVREQAQAAGTQRKQSMDSRSQP